MIIKTVRKAASFIKIQKKKNKLVGFVPTMGCLHEGHLSLIRKAKAENDLVAVSIFVNPAQFGPGEDFKRYPRNFKRDKVLARSAGADIIFYPQAKEIYPDNYKSFVEVLDITKRLCGESRPGHFRGVTTIVANLFNIIQPDKAYFGQKDAQQAIVIKRMVKDLNMNVKIKVLPIVRERDGLAMSSRNVYLSDKERKAAPVLFQSLKIARNMIKNGLYKSTAIRTKIRNIISSKKFVHIDYISIVDTESLKEVKVVKKKALIALATYIGKTRLIDNIIVGGKI